MATATEMLSTLTLKPDHAHRPVWTCADHSIYLDPTHTLFSKPVHDFLTAIAEAISRPPGGVHHYQLTEYSLYAAAATNIDDIALYLDRFSKNILPETTRAFIQTCTQHYGKARLVLRGRQFHVESPYPSVLQRYLQDPLIGKARDDDSTKVTPITSDTPMYGYDPDGSSDDEDEKQQHQKRELISFAIRDNTAATVKQRAKELGYPLLDEYEYKSDDPKTPNIPNMHFQFQPGNNLRSYQQTALSRMFYGQRARSGLVVLPCGAGKTVIGIAAATTINKPVLCICTNAVSVRQWQVEFQRWTTMAHDRVIAFTSTTTSNDDTTNKQQSTPAAAAPSSSSLLNYPCVIITTYSMMTHQGKRAPAAQRMLDAINGHHWGLLLLDEVHTAPAAVFRTVTSNVKAHCRLGLTATLVREDDLITDLAFLVGPKLYEAHGMELAAQGHLARVQCVEVQCLMTRYFEQAYHNTNINNHNNHDNNPPNITSMHRKQLLAVMNPNKARSLEYLVRFHEQRGDKIIVFSELKLPLVFYARMLRRRMIHGETMEWERQVVLEEFKEGAIQTLLLSRVGDMAIDLPDANVVIQVSSHFGSRQQEAQRLGRVMRPKSSPQSNNLQPQSPYDAWFYTLVSSGTKEVEFSAKRKQYLVDQGFTFEVVTDLLERVDLDPLSRNYTYATTADDETLLRNAIALLVPMIDN